MKVEDVVMFDKYKKDKTNNEDYILLDMNNTFYNIRIYIENKYKKKGIPIHIVNEGMGDRWVGVENII